MGKRGKYGTLKQFKIGEESRIPQLDSYNKFNVLAREIQVGILESERNKENVEERLLREITVKIWLERIDTQKGIMYQN